MNQPEYEIPYREATRAIVQQQQTLDLLRRHSLFVTLATWAITLFTTTATGDHLLYPVGALAISALLGLGVLKTGTFTFSSSPKILVEEWIEGKEYAYSLTETHKYLALLMGEHYNANQKIINRRARWFRWQVFTTTGAVFLLAAKAIYS